MGEGQQPPGAEPDRANSIKLKEKRERNKLPSKIVCRRLPPTMTEETFLEQVSPIPEYDYFYFAKPDPSLTPNLFCRAYINFVNVEDIYWFRDKFDDYIFLDDKGNEYSAIVEYAPFQRIPRKRRKKDIKSGTLNNDPTYLEFLESLKDNDSDCREPKMEYSYQLIEDSEKKEVSTPLLEYLAVRKREEKRRKEERQRRRPKNRNGKDEDVTEDDNKIKTKDEDNCDDNEEDLEFNDIVDYKDSLYQNRSKFRIGREYKRLAEEERKKSEINKKERSELEEDKHVRKERKDRYRENYKEKNREKLMEKKDKSKFHDKNTEEQNQEKKKNCDDDSISESKKNAPSTSNKNSEKSINAHKTSLVSSKIKPFTTLPQLNVSELTKVMDELDISLKKSVTNDSDNSNTVKTSDKKNDTEITDKVNKGVNSKNESKEGKSNSEANSRKSENVKKSKSKDEFKADKSEKSREDARAERRIRNKDRPSLAIYQPGMGKFSKQRIEREKDKTSDSSKTVNSLHSSSNSVNSQD